MRRPPGLLLPSLQGQLEPPPHEERHRQEHEALQLGLVQQQRAVPVPLGAPRQDLQEQRDVRLQQGELQRQEGPLAREGLRLVEHPVRVEPPLVQVVLLVAEEPQDAPATQQEGALGQLVLQQLGLLI